MGTRSREPRHPPKPHRRRSNRPKKKHLRLRRSLSLGQLVVMGFVTFVMISERSETPARVEWKLRFPLKAFWILIARAQMRLQDLRESKAAVQISE